ncbi:pimeloyl-ACP methyl ester carboxylesterase [Hasllibacter halocynthiae]|uniref:Pimeloyl-ACP methyl ester carboxylesterase n=1 Tax=Hasllibacter halocynthiae TaxID=595589 RepID=A0A2T0X8S1_9RHOB|nr:alpha/beta fold hydrolase [Hasllibacter halocynthiae]PRY95341.1 pimeloyl-ACP methyl ester carboxylesterase [Hasllibacter halocynthiae]
MRDDARPGPAPPFPARDALGVGGRRAAFHLARREGTVPAILLHGAGFDSAALSWRLFLPELARTRTVLAPDWPGQGGSAPLPRGPFRLSRLGGWLIALMDALGIERADLVGASMGGGAAIWTAAHHPHRVRRLVPVAPFGLAASAPGHRRYHLATRLPLWTAGFALMRRTDRGVRRALGTVFGEPDRITDALVAEVRAAMREGRNGRAFARFQRGEVGPRGFRTDLSDAAAALPHETLFLQGAKDRLIPPALARSVAARMARARFETLDAGHWPMREAPDAFAAHALPFLGATAREGR